MSNSMRGFTLLEVSICVLILGLSVFGIFNLLVWANKRYTATIESTEELINEYIFIRKIRKEICEGKFLCAAYDLDALYNKINYIINSVKNESDAKNIKIASFSIRLYNRNTYFIVLDILNTKSGKIKPRVLAYYIR